MIKIFRIDKKKLKQTFAKNLKTLRSKKGFTQEHVAESLDVSVVTIQKWESNQEPYDIKLSNLLKLSKFFQVSIDDLIKNSENNFFKNSL